MKAKSKRKPAAPARKPTAKAAKPKGGDKVLVAFEAREGSNQAKVLTRLAATLGKPVAVGEVTKAVYGKDDGNRGALAMVVRGIEAKVKSGKTGYRLVKSGERGAATLMLSATR